MTSALTTSNSLADLAVRIKVAHQAAGNARSATMTGVHAIDLEPFCYHGEGEDRVRSVGRPWSHSNYTYATDGTILVRVDRRPDVPENEHAFTAKAEKLLQPPLPKLLPMPPVELPAAPAEPNLVECLKCCGSGREHQCPDCECTCSHCGGSGKLEVGENVSVGIGKASFHVALIRLMLTLPGLEIRAKPSPKAPMPFRFQGGVGVVMPLIKKSEMQHIKVI